MRMAGKKAGGLPKRKIIARNRPIRRGQLISPFGVGAITDFRNDEALMCAGIDSWFDAAPPAELRIAEERLEARLGCDYFVLPPDFAENQGAPKRRIPYVRFPRWHYCPRCFRMLEVQLFGDQPFCTGCSDKGRGKRMIPIRIVAACEAGHIEDFPFRQWIGCHCENGGELYFKSGRSSASIQGTRIECGQCNKVNSLSNAFQPWALDGKQVQCSGSRPWLGHGSEDGLCGKRLQTLLRGASNLYFPVVSSSIYIPTGATDLDPKIQHVIDDPAKWTVLTSNIVDGQPHDGMLHMAAALYGVDPLALIAAISAKLSARAGRTGVPASEEAFRHQEFQVLREGNTDHRADLFCEPAPVSCYPQLSTFIKSVGLVRKLRETRVLTSFTRIHPPGGAESGEQGLSRDTKGRWLPAIVVKGEGIFIEFRDDVIGEWAALPDVKARIDPLIARYESQRLSRNLAPRGIDGRFLFIHTLAHILIRELTFLCGYGSSALRERIYCSLDDPSRPMLGLLIYTASGDSEGTLGGLVSQAEPGRLEPLFSGAIRRAAWCSNDPVCVESPAQGAGNANLAACHSCTLLPETSCEEGNRLMDRALIVGTIEKRQLGFFPHIGFSDNGLF